jgi:CO/xanthine dehydrogenase FAD-binding subunit
MHFAYEKPKTLDSLLALLSQHGSRACLLAGGTDLLVRLRARTLSPEIVIDVKGVEPLHALDHRADGRVVVGAAVVANRIVDDKRFRPSHRGLADAAARIATYAIRNRATIAGNIANASPCADSVPPLCVMGAQVEVASVRGTRMLTLPDYIKGVRNTVRRPDELITFIHIPRLGVSARTFFRKHQRVRGHDLALANAALLHDPESKRLRVAIGSCSPAPVVLDLDDLFASLDAEEAARRAMAAISPISDVRASAEYRTDMTGVLVRRLFADLKAA